MFDEAFARLRTHRSNIQRYRQLLETSLTDHERQFVTRRLAEEQSAIEKLSATVLPLLLEDGLVRSPRHVEKKRTPSVQLSEFHRVHSARSTSAEREPQAATLSERRRTLS